MSSKKDSKKDSKQSGNLNYLHKVIQQSLKDGKSSTLEEIVVDGPKGLSVKYFSKTGDNVDKIVIYGKDDSFKMKTSDGEKTLNKSELLNELKSNKKLKFAAEYAKTQKGGDFQEGGAKKQSSKKQSKKSSKQSNKTSKKTSKKEGKTLKGGNNNSNAQEGGAKKSSKNTSKKSSKNTTKKVSKKDSKKLSKKNSKKSSKTVKTSKTKPNKKM